MSRCCLWWGGHTDTCLASNEKLRGHTGLLPFLMGTVDVRPWQSGLESPSLWLISFVTLDKSFVLLVLRGFPTYKTCQLDVVACP